MSADDRGDLPADFMADRGVEPTPEACAEASAFHQRVACARIEAETGLTIFEYTAPCLAEQLQQHGGTFRLWWPHCFVRLRACGGGLWLPLNRHNKPLGIGPLANADYEAFAERAWRFSRPRDLDGVWRQIRRGRYYLYPQSGVGGRDGFVDYALRLAWLLEAADDGYNHFCRLARVFHH